MAVRVILIDRVRAALGTLPSVQLAQFNRLIQALRLSPQAGLFYVRDRANRALYIASASDIHLIYHLHFFIGRDEITIVDLIVAEWTPPAAHE